MSSRSMRLCSPLTKACSERKEIDMGNYVKKKKKDMVFQSVDSLQQVVNVLNEAAVAVNDKTRTIRHSAIPEVLTGALGAGIGGVGSFLALYGLGTVGLSAAGITSGLAAAGAIVGGGMVAGVFVLAAPVAALAAGRGWRCHSSQEQTAQARERTPLQRSHSKARRYNQGAKRGSRCSQRAH